MNFTASESACPPKKISGWAVCSLAGITCGQNYDNSIASYPRRVNLATKQLLPARSSTEPDNMTNGNFRPIVSASLRTLPRSFWAATVLTVGLSF